MFAVEDRDRLCQRLIATAREDDRVGAAALLGSAARGQQDPWSDIDLALGIVAEAEHEPLVAEWSERMYDEHGAVHHVDVSVGQALYRVFLLRSTLQVDLSFWPLSDFAATGPDFQQLFGPDARQQPIPLPDPAELIGMGWLYALHARSSIARGRAWQAEYMISGARDQVLAIACLRHGVSPYQARGVDLLPPGATASVQATLVKSLQASELKRSFRATIEALLGEIELTDRSLATRLTAPLHALADSLR
jgi:predicted nucleotidyltransferase